MFCFILQDRSVFFRFSELLRCCHHCAESSDRSRLSFLWLAVYLFCPQVRNIWLPLLRIFFFFKFFYFLWFSFCVIFLNLNMLIVGQISSLKMKCWDKFPHTWKLKDWWDPWKVNTIRTFSWMRKMEHPKKKLGSLPLVLTSTSLHF